METDDVIEIQTERMSFGPAAVGRLRGASVDGRVDSMVVFVHGAAANEKVRAKLVKKHKNYWDAELVEVLTPSADRVEPACPVFDRCGGCQWQHLSYDAQVEAKKQILLHQLQRATGISSDQLQTKLEIHSAASPFGYRSRIQARGDHDGLGFYEKGSHNVVHTDRCIVAHPDIQNAWTACLEKGKYQGFSRPFKIEWTRTESGQMMEAINRNHAAFGFTQVNSEQNAVLVELVSRLAPKKPLGIAFDLYGGNGNLSAGLASHFNSILCVDAYNAGKNPAEIAAPLSQGQVFVRADVRSFLQDRYWQDWAKDVAIECVIADPPRSGLEDSVQAITDLRAPSLLLVSCDVSTLARDLTTVLKAYTIDEIHLIDMFPQTYHFEVLLGLRLT